MNKKELAAKFHHDVENICKELIDAFSLKFKQEVPNLSSPLCRWLDFRYRYIDPQPRKVVFSDRFPKKRLPDTAQRGLKKMIRAIKLGKDINPYQGRGLTLRNDFSGDKKIQEQIYYGLIGIFITCISVLSQFQRINTFQNRLTT